MSAIPLFISLAILCNNIFLGVLILDIIMEGTVSQIFDLGPSSYSI